MVTIHRAPHRQKACVWWGAARFPKGIVWDTSITTTVPCSLQHDTFHFGLGRPLVLHTCYYLSRDPGYGTPHNPEVQTRVWILVRFVHQLPYLVLWQGAHGTQSVVVRVLHQLPYLVLWQGAHGTQSVVVRVLHNEDNVRTAGTVKSYRSVWRTLGGYEECVQKFVGAPLGKWPLERLKWVWEDDINIIKEKHCEIGSWL
jgi:hypothetical protein